MSEPDYNGVTVEAEAKRYGKQPHIDYNRFPHRFLLTGAGFTKNFGGWLAAEFQEHLLSKAQIRSSPELLQLVQTVPSFEQALAKARNGLITNVNLKALEEAIVDGFKDQEMALRGSGIDGSINQTRLALFMSQFCNRWRGYDTGFLFTVNQDLWFERYLRRTKHTNPLELLGVDFYFPMSSTNFQRMNRFTMDASAVINGDSPPGNKKLEPAGFFNIVKLHGSHNWRTEGGGLLIIGGDKESAIKKSAFLTAYAELFRELLVLEDARLFIIGYGFNDPHINVTIEEACTPPNSLKLWIWDRGSLSDMCQKLLSNNMVNASRSVHGFMSSAFGEVFSMHGWSQDAFGRIDMERKALDPRIMAFFGEGVQPLEEFYPAKR